MAKKKATLEEVETKNTAAIEEEMKAAEKKKTEKKTAVHRYSKQQIISSKKYRKYIELRELLSDDKTYTSEEIEALIIQR